MTQPSTRNPSSHITDGLCALEETPEPQFPYLKSTCLCVYVCVGGDFEGASGPDILCF